MAVKNTIGIHDHTGTVGAQADTACDDDSDILGEAAVQYSLAQRFDDFIAVGGDASGTAAYKNRTFICRSLAAYCITKLLKVGLTIDFIHYFHLSLSQAKAIALIPRLKYTGEIGRLDFGINRIIYEHGGSQTAGTDASGYFKCENPVFRRAAGLYASSFSRASTTLAPPRT
jgi:hypothetical protein